MNFLSSLPRQILVGVVLVVALGFIVLSRPPHTPCDSQLEIFQDAQKGRLFSQKIHGIDEPARILALEKTCKETNSSGGCFELFINLHRILASAMDIPVECRDKLTSVDELTSLVKRNLVLMTKLAWAEKPPESVYVRNGWLEPTDLALFCQLAEFKKKYESSEAWYNLQNQILNDLPGGESIEHNQKWKLSILATDCRTFL